MSSYADFLASKQPTRKLFGFEPLWIPAWLFDFQADLTRWNVRQGRSATFADCGLGKTPMQLVWAENIVRKFSKPVLILTPLAVAAQMVREAEKFGIEVHRTKQGTVHKGINITNYQRLGYYNPKDFVAVSADEGSILKNFDGKTRKAVTDSWPRWNSGASPRPRPPPTTSWSWARRPRPWA